MPPFPTSSFTWMEQDAHSCSSAQYGVANCKRQKSCTLIVIWVKCLIRILSNSVWTIWGLIRLPQLYVVLQSLLRSTKSTRSQCCHSILLKLLYLEIVDREIHFGKRKMSQLFSTILMTSHHAEEVRGYQLVTKKVLYNLKVETICKNCIGHQTNHQFVSSERLDQGLIILIHGIFVQKCLRSGQQSVKVKQKNVQKKKKMNHFRKNLEKV